MHRFAKELVALQPDLILSQATPTTAALFQETRTIPIVFAIVADPVGSGFVASLARPGGNATGFVVTEGYGIGCQRIETMKRTRGLGFWHFSTQTAGRDFMLVVGITPTGNRDAGKFAADATQLPTGCQPGSLAKLARRRSHKATLLTCRELTARTPKRSGHRHRCVAYLADIARAESRAESRAE